MYNPTKPLGQEKKVSEIPARFTQRREAERNLNRISAQGAARQQGILNQPRFIPRGF
jgi:hypothetical protein